MKKSYLMIAAAAALFAACSSNDVFKEIESQDTLIGFDTYAQKATRSENSGESYSLNLKDHHNQFKVWGYKNTSVTAVFSNEDVTYNTTSSKWEYTNNRYWDKAATTYAFYAYAPASSDAFTFNGVSGVSTQNAGYFTIGTAYTKAGKNASPKNSDSPISVWPTAAGNDVDLMIAAPAILTGSDLSTAKAGNVTLNFIHILSRLNITVKTTSAFVGEGKDKVKVTNITVGKMNTAGTFDESTTLASGVLEGGTNARWTPSSVNNYSYDMTYTATTDANYVVEALIIPQTAGVEAIELDGSTTETEPYIAISYSVYNSTETTPEDFVAYYNLATLFGKNGTQTLAFNEGWQNTLNITIEPGLISFDAKVAAWDDMDPAGSVEVK